MKIWILTKYYNLYDQQGGYFIAAFTSKKLAEDSVDHIGRHTPENDYQNWEEEWYELEEVKLDTFGE